MERILENALAEMQGKLFEMSGNLGYDSEVFMRVFMRSEIARKLDSDFDFMQWAGKEYIMEKMEDEYADQLVKSDKIFDRETLYWAGYLYRKWHYHTGESSKDIYRHANAKTINSVYLGYHCMDIEMAIDRLLEN